MMRTRILILMILTGCALAFPGGHAKAGRNEVNIIPRPVSLRMTSGEFVIDGETRIAVAGENAELESIARRLALDLRRLTGREIPVVDGEDVAGAENFILLSLSEAEGAGREDYFLNVRKRSIEVIGGGPAGVFYGVQTLHQILPLDAGGGDLAVPCLRIKDRPRFVWRGAHLDVCRHFFPVRFVKKYIDILAMYKINTFHWHLTEDQGWRIEIKKYPRLTEISSNRAETTGTAGRTAVSTRRTRSRRSSGTRRSATSRSCPRSRCPATPLAALAAYPELSCTGGPFEVMTQMGRSRGRLLRRQRRGLHLPRGRPRRGPRALPVDIHPHRRRRVPQGPVEGMPEVPGADRERGPRRRARAAELVRPADREISPLRGTPADRLGRDPRGRARAERHRDVLARDRRRDRRGEGGARRSDVADIALLPRLLPGADTMSRRGSAVFSPSRRSTPSIRSRQR